MCSALCSKRTKSEGSEEMTSWTNLRAGPSLAPSRGESIDRGRDTTSARGLDGYRQPISADSFGGRHPRPFSGRDERCLQSYANNHRCAWQRRPTSLHRYGAEGRDTIRRLCKNSRVLEAKQRRNRTERFDYAADFEKRCCLTVLRTNPLARDQARWLILAKSEQLALVGLRRLTAELVAEAGGSRWTQRRSAMWTSPWKR